MDVYVDGSTDLSFVRKVGPHLDFWHLEPTADWGEDCRVGRDAASELTRYMDFARGPNLLGSVVREMIQKGRFTGLEVGFCQRIAECAMGPAFDHDHAPDFEPGA